jgi:protein transport protein SEC23
LLLDTYFNVLLWLGSSIELWENEQLHKKREYEHVAALLEAPNDDISYLMDSRFPVPGFWRIGEGHSKERILKAKISPTMGEGHSENMPTDEKNIHEFMKVLIEIVVNGKPS